MKLFSLVTHSIMLWNLARCMCSFRASVSLSIRTEWSIAEATSSNYSFVNFVEFWYRPAEAWCTFIVVMCDFIPAFFHAKSIMWATVVITSMMGTHAFWGSSRNQCGSEGRSIFLGGGNSTIPCIAEKQLLQVWS